MSKKQLIMLYVVTTGVFFAGDFLWLGFVAPSLYEATIGHLLGPVNVPAAIVFYLLYILGILIFVLIPALQRRSLRYALQYGALFGFFCYATYDFTNLATLRDWPVSISLIDTVWGTVLTGSVATVSYYIAHKWLRI